MNTDASYQAEDPAKCPKNQAEYEYVYRPKGPALEVAALNMLNGVDPNVDAREMLKNLRATSRQLFSLPFDQTLKRKTVVYQISNEEARVVVKGSPESIAEVMIASNGEPEDLPAQIEQFCAPLMEMAQDGLKLLSYAYKDVSLDDIKSIQD